MELADEPEAFAYPIVRRGARFEHVALARLDVVRGLGRDRKAGFESHMAFETVEPRAEEGERTERVARRLKSSASFPVGKPASTPKASA
jgi:hypothetical protein